MIQRYLGSKSAQRRLVLCLLALGQGLIFQLPWPQMDYPLPALVWIAYLVMIALGLIYDAYASLRESEVTNG